MSSYQAQSVSVALDRAVHVNADGEVFEDTRCDYRALPRAARFLVGAAPFIGQA